MSIDVDEEEEEDKKEKVIFLFEIQKIGTEIVDTLYDELMIQDKDVSSVASKHLIVVGGSCINTVAAKILESDSPLCGADFSAATNVGAGGYIIKTVKSPENDAKVAMLVAGYNAADTTNAIKRAMVIDGVSTVVGAEEIYPIVA